MREITNLYSSYLNVLFLKSQFCEHFVINVEETNWMKFDIVKYEVSPYESTIRIKYHYAEIDAN